mgnify:CR=1 FL=1
MNTQARRALHGGGWIAFVLVATVGCSQRTGAPAKATGTPVASIGRAQPDAAQPAPQRPDAAQPAPKQPGAAQTAPLGPGAVQSAPQPVKLKQPSPVAHDVVQRRVAEYMKLTRKITLLPLGVRRNGEVLSVAVATPGRAPIVDQVLTTKDGRVLLEDALDIDLEIASLGADRRFAGCLINAGVRLFIDSSKKIDQQQRAMIGRFSNTVVTDCHAAGKDACVRQKIDKTPTWLLGTTRIEGPQTRPWLEAATACK